MTPTQRTLAELRRLGYLAAVVEKWNPHAKVRQDLFGIVDVLAIGTPGEPEIPELGVTLAVQATTGSNVASRIDKLRASPALPRLLGAGWHVEVWGWRKSARTKRWELRREVVSGPE